MMDRTSLPVALDAQGVVLLPALLNAAQLSRLWAAIAQETLVGAVRGRSGAAYGARGLLRARPELVQQLAEVGLPSIAGAALRRPAVPIDAVSFDKHVAANWAVPSHQDVVVPVPAGAELSSLRNVRIRDGVTYAEPAECVLRELVALRISFDDAGVENGALEVVPGSHLRGRLSDADLRRTSLADYRQYPSRAGDVLLVKPLVVHRSARSLVPARRRVLQVVYAPEGGGYASLSGRAA